jgi:hypothetical protein
MKKVFLSAALALAVAVSWAFYPKAAAQPARMMVVGSFAINGYGADIGLATISETGEQKNEEVPFKGKSISREGATAALLQLRAAELSKVQVLSREGWVLTHITPASATGVNLGLSQTVYLLEKQ